VNKIELQKKRRARRKKTIRKSIIGTAKKPRISVFKSNKYIYVQAINDDKGVTIASASTIAYKNKDKKINITNATKVGEDLGKKLKEKKINEAVFDRNGFVYIGRVKALADGARKEGIKF